MSGDAPSTRELVEFQQRYGLEAYLVWACAIVNLSAPSILNIMRIGRYFGPLDASRYEISALSEMLRIDISQEALTEIIQHVKDGSRITLELVRGIVGTVGTGNGGTP